MNARLTSLREQLDAKYGEIFDLIASQLGYSDRSKLSASERTKLKEETDQAIEQWEETAEMELIPPEPTVPLQHLLRQHHNIAVEILDIKDE